jgi:PAS domain S-box-containing protein
MEGQHHHAGNGQTEELLQQLKRAEEALQQHFNAGIDAVIDSEGRSVLLRDAQHRLVTSEAEQRKAAERLISILDALPANIALLNQTGEIVLVNEPWRKFGRENGMTLRDFGVGVNYLSVCQGADAMLATHLAAVLRGELPHYSVEYPCHAPLKKRWFRLMAANIRRDGAGGAVVMHIDTTERVMVEQALRLREEELRTSALRLERSEAEYRLLFRNNPQPMWVYAKDDLRILAVNDAALRNYGYTEAEFLCLRVTDIVASAEADSLKRELAEGNIGDKQRIRAQHHRRDGTVVDVEITANNLAFNERQCRLVLATDVTEKLRLQSQSDRATRALQLLSEINDLLVKVEDERELLHRVCATAIEFCGFDFAWVGYAVKDSKFPVVAQTFCGRDAGYLDRLTQGAPELSGEKDRIAEVIQNGTAAVVNGCDQGCGASGFIGAVYLPMSSQNRTFGVLALYSVSAAALSNDEIRLLQRVADNVAFGIINLRLRADRQSMYDVVLGISDAVSATTGGEFFQRFITSLVRILNASVGLIIRSPSTDAQPSFQECWAVANGEQLIGSAANQLHPSPDCFDERGVYFAGASAGHYFRTSKQDILLAGVCAMRLVSPSAEAQMGVLVLGFDKPIRRAEFVVSALKIFASRVAAEMEREKAIQRAIEQSALIDQVHDAVVVRDMNDKITFWSGGSKDLYGYTPEQALGQKIGELLKPDSGRFAEASDEVRLRGRWSGELEKVTMSGEKVTIDCRWTLLRDPSGNPKSILALDADISERRRLEKQLLRAQRMDSIGTLAGGVAHDLNNLLSPIIMGVDLLRVIGVGDAASEVLENISKSAERGTNLVKQILAFARGDQGTKVAMSVMHLLREMQGIVITTFPKNIHVEIASAPDLWLISGDPTQINQVLLNLCINARDAMPSGGCLKLTAANILVDENYAAMSGTGAPGRYVCIDVADTGCGIASEVLEKIFDPFFTTKQLGHGTGLGLSTALSIVRAHGGFINVSSKVNSGSVFSVFLPAAAEGVAAASVSGLHMPPPAVRGHGELILLVDDEDAVRQVSQQTLEAFGYRVIAAANGADAVALYAMNQQRVCLVITDIMMPIMGGAVLLDILRRMDPKIRVVGSSGAADGPHSEGFAQFLIKPYSAETLLMAVAAALHSHP